MPDSPLSAPPFGEVPLDFNDWGIVFPGGPGWAWALWIGVVVAAGVWGWWGLARLRSPTERRMLWALRVLIAILIGVPLLEPALQWRRVIREKTRVILLADRSRSMALPAGDLSRAEAISDWITRHSELLDRLAQDHVLVVETFAEDVRAATRDDLARNYLADGRRTALLDAVRGVSRRHLPEETAGILLFSDGVDNAPPADATAPEGAPELVLAPIDVFVPDQRKLPRDVAVDEVRYDDFAFVRNTVTVQATIRSRGFGGRNVAVRLDQDGATIDAQTVTLNDDTPAPVRFQFKPDRIGRFTYGITVPVLEGESVAANNQRRFIIKVIRDRVRVVHVVGRPDIDMRFTREFLKSNPNIDLISFFILRTGDDSYMVNQNELSLIPFPSKELFDTELHTFDLVIFQNFNFRDYQMAQYLPNIARFVRQGGGFLMIGGDLSFIQGGYARTAIEDILPVTLNDGASGGKVAHGGKFKPQLTPAGLRHPITALSRDDAENRRLWTDLPAMDGLNLGLVPRPDAVVLLGHPTIKVGGEGAPVAAVRAVDKGRSMAVALDSTWRWHLTRVREGGTPAEYRTFWNNAFRWLLKDPDLQHLQLIPARDDVRPGEPVEVNVRVLDESFLPAALRSVRVSARLKSGSAPAGNPPGSAGAAPARETPAPPSAPGVPNAVKPSDGSTSGGDGTLIVSETLATDDNGMARFVFPAPAVEGEVVVEANVTLGRSQVERETINILVTGADQEWADIRVAADVLSGLARRSGGKVHAISDTVSRRDLSLKAPRVAKVVGKKDVPLWDNAYMFLTLAGLIAVEWLWRKMRRLP